MFPVQVANSTAFFWSGVWLMVSIGFIIVYMGIVARLLRRPMAGGLVSSPNPCIGAGDGSGIEISRTSGRSVGSRSVTDVSVS